MFSELQGLPIDSELVKRILCITKLKALFRSKRFKNSWLITTKSGFRFKVCHRAKPIVVPRQIAMYLIKKFLDKSLVDIGKAFGGKSHYVMNALDRVKNLQSTDQDISKDIEDLEQRIHNITGV